MQDLNMYHCCGESVFVEKNEEIIYATPKCPVCNRNMKLAGKIYTQKGKENVSNAS